MLRIAGAVIIILASVKAGRYFAYVLERRLRILKDIDQGLLALEREISYARTPLPQALAGAAKMSGEGGAIFRIAGEKLLAGEGIGAQEAWRESLKETSSDLGLKEPELEILYSFSAGLGLSHYEDQLKRIDISRQRLAALIGEADEYKNKFSKIWKNLGWMAGLALVLIFF